MQCKGNHVCGGKLPRDDVGGMGSPEPRCRAKRGSHARAYVAAAAASAWGDQWDFDSGQTLWPLHTSSVLGSDLSMVVQEREEQRTRGMASKAQPPPWLGFLSGTIGGMAGVIVGFPFDTVKVRMQLAARGDAFAFARRLWHTEGARGFYRGVSSPLAGDGVTNAIVFGVYGVTSAALRRWRQRRQQRAEAASEAREAGGAPVATAPSPLTTWELGVCGGAAGLAATTVITPVELIKTRLQMEDSVGSQREHRRRGLYSGPLDVLRKVARSQRGWRGLWSGWTPCMVRDGPGFAVYFVVNDAILRYTGTGAMWHLLAGGMGGVASWVATYPVDVVKTRMQTQPDTGYRTYHNPWHCARLTYRQGGMRIFWMGLGPALSRAFPLNATIFGTVSLINGLVTGFNHDHDDDDGQEDA